MQRHHRLVQVSHGGACRMRHDARGRYGHVRSTPSNPSSYVLMRPGRRRRDRCLPCQHAIGSRRSRTFSVLLMALGLLLDERATAFDRNVGSAFWGGGFGNVVWSDDTARCDESVGTGDGRYVQWSAVIDSKTTGPLTQVTELVSGLLAPAGFRS